MTVSSAIGQIHTYTYPFAYCVSKAFAFHKDFSKSLELTTTD